jgi:CheY-like chemotaxis protein
MVRVLIVDDSKLARMVVSKALGALYPEWTRSEAANSDEALALAKDGQFELAMIDFNMPGRDGLALAADLKSISPETALIVLSANVQNEVIERTRGLGGVFLAKPLHQEELAAVLADMAAAAS